DQIVHVFEREERDREGRNELRTGRRAARERKDQLERGHEEPTVLVVHKDADTAGDPEREGEPPLAPRVRLNQEREYPHRYRHAENEREVGRVVVPVKVTAEE